MSENLYNNINKFMNMQETMLNQSTQYARELDLKFLTINALSNLNLLKISQLTKAVREQTKMTEEMLYNIQVVRERKNLNERQILTDVSAVLRHALAEADGRVHLEGVRAKVQSHVPTSYALEEDHDRELFKELMRILRGKVLDNYVLLRERQARQKQLNIEIDMLTGLETQWEEKCAKLQRRLKFECQKQLLNAQLDVAERHNERLSGILFYTRNLLKQLAHHQAVFTDDIRALLDLVNSGKLQDETERI